jgi:hypothetical protein
MSEATSEATNKADFIPRKLPKKVWLDERWYMRVQLVPKSEIEGSDGEWVYHPHSTDGCFGIARIAKEQGSFDRWTTFREELQHALVDFQRWNYEQVVERLGKEINKLKNISEEEEEDGTGNSA